MKIKVKTKTIIVRPKQREAKIVVRFYDFEVKPKRNGVVLKKLGHSSILKRDAISGCVLIRKGDTNIVRF